MKLKNWFSIKLISLWIISLIFCVNYIWAWANSLPLDFDQYMANINANLSTNIDDWNVTNVIANYCKTVLNNDILVEDNVIHLAKQSVWVYIVCSNINAGMKSSFDDNLIKYVKTSSWKELWIQDLYNSDPENSDSVDLCKPWSNMSYCKIEKHFPKALNQILNDYVNIKQSTIYWLVITGGTDDIIKNQADLFSSKYFNWLEICKENTTRKYPQTCKTLQKYINNMKKLLNKIEILNVGAIQNDADTKACNINNNSNIIMCGLYGDSQDSLWSFVNIMYNELFYYRLFVDYYTMVLNNHPEILWNNTNQSQINEIIIKFNNEYLWSKKALSISIRMLRDVNFAFPLHIWFMMYSEELDWFGKQLMKIVTPIYTLYDKFRNVQKPK